MGTELPPGIVDWIEDVTGGHVVRTDRRPAGARKEAWYIDVERDGALDELFLRIDQSGTDPARDPWTLQREAVVYLALQDTEVPVPQVIAVHPVEQAMLSRRLVGENWFARIRDPDEQLSTAQDFITKLAALHRLDVQALDLPGFPKPTSVADAVHAELDELESVLDARGGAVDPATRFTLEWLRRNVPSPAVPVVLVQGDTGPGNFMYRDGKVVAVVDWELAHLGDPMDDIAWLSLRAVQEPFTHLPDRLAEYEALTGNTIDEQRVWYYRVLAEAKLLVMSHRPRGEGTPRAQGAGEIGNGLIYGVLHRRLWLEALAAVMAIELEDPPTAPARPPSEHDWLYDAVLDELREVIVPRVTDPLALQRSKSLARIVKYLAAVNRDGAFYDASELDEAAALLGTRPGDVDEARRLVAAAVERGSISDDDYLRHQWRRVARDNELLRSASGVMADRHWPPLR